MIPFSVFHNTQWQLYWMKFLQLKKSPKPSGNWRAAKLRELMKYHRRSGNMGCPALHGKLPIFFWSAVGNMTNYLKTFDMQSSSPCTTTKGIKADCSNYRTISRVKSLQESSSRGWFHPLLKVTFWKAIVDVEMVSDRHERIRLFECSVHLLSLPWVKHSIPLFKKWCKRCTWRFYTHYFDQGPCFDAIYWNGALRL